MSARKQKNQRWPSSQTLVFWCLTILASRCQNEKLREPDLNRRPRGYEPRELPGCSIPHRYNTHRGFHVECKRAAFENLSDEFFDTDGQSQNLHSMSAQTADLTTGFVTRDADRAGKVQAANVLARRDSDQFFRMR